MYVNKLLGFFGVAAFALTATTARAQDRVADEKKEFQATVKHLDMDGNLLVFMNAKQTQATITKGLEEIVRRFQNHPARDFRQFGKASAIFKQFYDVSGFGELTAVGMSCAARNEKSYRNKIVLKSKDAPKGVVWNMFGSESKLLKSLEVLPANTCLATATFLDLDAILKWLEKQSMGGTEFANGMGMLSVNATKFFDKEKMLKGYGGEMGIFVTLDDEKSMTIPLNRRRSVKLPEVSLGLFVKVNDDYLEGFLKNKFVDFKATSETVTIDGVTVQKNSFPRYDGPFPFTPMVASVNGYLFMASNEGLMKEIIAVSKGTKKGLSSTKEFAEMSKGIESVGNSYHVVTPDFSKTFISLMEGLAAAEGSRSDREMYNLFLSQKESISSFWSYGTMVRDTDGLRLQVNSRDGSGLGVVLQLGSAPLTVGGVMIAPAIASARVKAHRANSAGNLKQIALAMLGYSGDYGGDFPKKEGVAGFNKIIETNDLPLSKVYINPRDAERIEAFDGRAKWLKEGTCSYVYVGGGLRDDNMNSSNMALAWEKPCGDDWCNVLFIDGHVQGFKGTFKTNVDVVKMLKKEMGYSDEQFQFYLKKAIRQDAIEGVEGEELEEKTTKELDALVKQLGAADFKTRKQAQDALKKHLPKAYQYLLKKMKETKDPEIKERIKKLLGMGDQPVPTAPKATRSNDEAMIDFFGPAN